MGAQLETTGKWLIFPIDILKFIVFYFLILLETFFFQDFVLFFRERWRVGGEAEG